MVFIIYNLQKHSRMKSNEYFKIIIRIQCANNRKSNDNNSIKFYILKYIYTKGNFRKDPHKHIWLYFLRIHVVIYMYILPESAEFRNVPIISVGKVFRNPKGLSDRRSRLLHRVMFRDRRQRVQIFLLLRC